MFYVMCVFLQGAGVGEEESNKWYSALLFRLGSW